MKDHTKICVEIFCELTKKTTEQLHKVATLCMDDHQFKEDENEAVQELSTIYSPIILKTLWETCCFVTVIKHAFRAVTKWTKSSDKRLTLMISYIHHASEYRQHCYEESKHDIPCLDYKEKKADQLSNKTNGLSLTNCSDLKWISTSLLHSQAHQYVSAYFFVFSDSVL